MTHRTTGAGHDHLSSGELRLPAPKDPEHEVVCITDLFENKPKAATEGGLSFCVGNGAFENDAVNEYLVIHKGSRDLC